MTTIFELETGETLKTLHFQSRPARLHEGSTVVVSDAVYRVARIEQAAGVRVVVVRYVAPVSG